MSPVKLPPILLSIAKDAPAKFEFIKIVLQTEKQTFLDDGAEDLGRRKNAN